MSGSLATGLDNNNGIVLAPGYRWDPVLNKAVLINPVTPLVGTTPQTTTPVIGSSDQTPGSIFGGTVPTINPTVNTPTGTITPTNTTGGASVVPGNATGNSQINVADLGGQLALDPSALFNDENTLSENIPQFTDDDINNGLIDPNSAVYKQLADIGIDPATIRASTISNTKLAEATLGTTTPAQAAQAKVEAARAEIAKAIAAKKATLATTDPTYKKIIKLENQMKAAVGTVSQGAIINPNEIPLLDVDATGKGLNETGKALNDSATQGMSSIIDTTTMAGRILAEQLGEGNYTDSKATVKGQLDILQAEFTGPNGEPKIPAWAAGTARGVMRIAAFKGATGTAAIAALSQALMEASLPIAQQDAKFFETLTIKNLDNKQQSIINKANVLAKMDLTNADMRMQAAIENANKFMQMDLANLNNEQQARIINTQARIQSILEDAKAENTARMFNAQSQNDMDKFYDNLNVSIELFNVAQKNGMAQFNVGERNETNRLNASLKTDVNKFNAAEANRTSLANAAAKTQVSMFNAGEMNETNKFNVAQKNDIKKFNASEVNDVRQFNADLENNREQFYKNMQFQVDTANSKWRQTITLGEKQMQFEAAATDVKNRLGVSVEQLNRLWDRADSILDYAWKTGENERDRQAQIAITKLQGDIDMQKESIDETGSFFGTLLGFAGRTVLGAFGY